MSSNMASARSGCLQDCSFSAGCLSTIMNGAFGLNQSSALQTEMGATGQVGTWTSHRLLGEGKACLGTDAGTGFMCRYVSPCVAHLLALPEDETALFLSDLHN